jgi:hypothetical protein
MYISNIDIWLKHLENKRNKKKYNSKRLERLEIIRNQSIKISD